MRTPYGQDCKYYYADFNRGRNEQLCQLVRVNPDSEPWIPDVCKDCPVPGIARANACEYMQLRGRVAKGLLGFGRNHLYEALKSGGGERRRASPLEVAAAALLAYPALVFSTLESLYQRGATITIRARKRSDLAAANLFCDNRAPKAFASEASPSGQP